MGLEDYPFAKVEQNDDNSFSLTVDVALVSTSGEYPFTVDMENSAGAAETYSMTLIVNYSVEEASGTSLSGSEEEEESDELGTSTPEDYYEEEPYDYYAEEFDV